jgi:hypothetical protein
MPPCSRDDAGRLRGQRGERGPPSDDWSSGGPWGLGGVVSWPLPKSRRGGCPAGSGRRRRQPKTQVSPADPCAPLANVGVAASRPDLGCCLGTWDGLMMGWTTHAVHGTRERWGKREEQRVQKIPTKRMEQTVSLDACPPAKGPSRSTCGRSTQLMPTPG